MAADEADSVPDLGDEVRAAAHGVGDRLARSVARAKIAGALFARDERVALGRYQLVDRVGSGGMGAVWSAWDPELERSVAVKLLHPALAADRDRILGEGQKLARLAHPNVISIFDVGVVDDQVYLVMEWVRGATLRAFGKTAPTARLIEAYREAGAGLAAAHRTG
ncbi:MAG TPA: protein kinase, partial [Kofleriaceae bacterium]